MKTKLSVILILVAILAACAPATVPAPTPDAALISTAAAQTVIANLTLTASAWTPTSEPRSTATSTPQATATQADAATATITTLPTLPGGTPGATQVILCDRYTWNNATVDVNIPDGTQMQPGQAFVKTWKIKNAGTCTWGAGYKVVYAGYTDQMSGVAQPLGVVGPGQEIEITVQFKAPTKVGDYVSAWTLQNPGGRNFFGNSAKPLYVKITVKL